MRAPNIGIFHDTVAQCFDEVVGWMGDPTKSVLYSLLQRRGITKNDVSARFKDVEAALVGFAGGSARSILIGTLRRICDEYSIPLNLHYSESLEGRLDQVRETVLVQKLLPKHYRNMIDTSSFEDKKGLVAPWSD